ncbi:isochorismatase [Myriangium duriaei CBS 260.36]|uniref:Isochorismatase n=1 Tax=Myriangium duriaei CBS 260.36 TaxID=1168546 RepID=A0A9P4ITE8_9PEZI|nr:isochorismatase [Myriangium duriaei CBS 260.36]
MSSATAASFRELIGVKASTASPTDSTLVIIDAQNEYANGQLKVSNVSSSRKAIESLLKKYRAADGKIVHVVHQTPSGAPVFTPKSGLDEEFEELAPRPGEKVVTKVHPSSFADTDLNEHLKEIGSQKIVLTGYMAHVCVSTTAREGAQLGYDVVLAADAIGDRDIPGVKAEDLTRVALQELGDAFGTVVQSGDIK